MTVAHGGLACDRRVAVDSRDYGQDLDQGLAEAEGGDDRGHPDQDRQHRQAPAEGAGERLTRPQAQRPRQAEVLELVGRQPGVGGAGRAAGRDGLHGAHPSGSQGGERGRRHHADEDRGQRQERGEGRHGGWRGQVQLLGRLVGQGQAESGSGWDADQATVKPALMAAPP